ncbi:MAG: response regulator [Planctomycetes bacterium]|nr:response regulator [Planctomycetota bacterium]
MNPGKGGEGGGREVYTTGQVAKICGVTIRTVIKWFESGKLDGYKIPASRDRRIPRDALLRFLDDHRYPYDPSLLDPSIRVLVADDEPAIVAMIAEDLARLDGVEVHRAHSGYEAGYETARIRPHLLLIDYNLGDLDAEQVLATLARDEGVKDMRVLVMTGFLSDDEVRTLQRRGLRVLRKPLDPRAIVAEIEDLRTVSRRSRA